MEATDVRDAPVDRVPDAAVAGPQAPWAAPVAATVALASSLVGLTTRPIWTDEAISIAATHQLGPTLRGTGGTMGAYYVLLDGWTAVWGTSAAAIRTPSALLAAAVVLVAGPTIRRSQPRLTALVALGLLAVLPGLARAGQEARSYALAMVLAAAAWGVASRLVTAPADGRTEQNRRAVALAALCTLGVLAHGMFALQVLALAASVAVLPDRRRLLPLVAPAVALSAGTAGGLMAVGAGGVADWIEPLRLDQLAEIGSVLLSPVRAGAVLLALIAVVGGLTVATGHTGPAETSAARWHRLLPLWWGAAPAVALVALSVVRPYFVGRYLLPSLPGLAMLIAAGAVALARAAATRGGDDAARRRITAVAAVALAAVLGAALVTGRAALDDVDVEPWPAVAAAVADRAVEGDAIVFTASSGAIAFSTRTPFDVAWAGLDDPAAGPRPVDDVEPLGDVARLYEERDAAEAERRLADSDRIWVVHKTRRDSGDEPYHEVLARPGIAGRFEVVDQWGFDGPIWVVLLART
ncbi:MAG TPA: hypothetical protein VK507_06650 [Iamia sp.]|nr:hypothetical protein [Iamia sp.]